MLLPTKRAASVGLALVGNGLWEVSHDSPAKIKTTATPDPSARIAPLLRSNPACAVCGGADWGSAAAAPATLRLRLFPEPFATAYDQKLLPVGCLHTEIVVVQRNSRLAGEINQRGAKCQQRSHEQHRNTIFMRHVQESAHKGDDDDECREDRGDNSP